MATLDEFELRLRGTDVADGDLTFAAVSRITGALQLLATRIGRSLVGQDGPGRSPTAVEAATTLRLRGAPQPGSTVLAIGVGQEGVLGEGLEHQTVDQLFALMTGLATDTPPPDTSAQVGQAVVQVAEALTFSATSCDFRSPRRSMVRLTPGAVSRAVWPTEEPEGTRRADTVVTGRLDLVDLRRARFRIKDAVGNDIHLHDVADAADAAQLVGRLVTASGDATFGTRGQMLALYSPHLRATEPLRWSLPRWDPSAATPPVADGISGVSEGEVAEFLELIRE